MKTDTEKQSEFLEFLNDALYHARINGFKQTYGGGLTRDYVKSEDKLSIFFKGNYFEIKAKDIKISQLHLEYSNEGYFEAMDYFQRLADKNGITEDIKFIRGCEDCIAEVLIGINNYITMVVS